MSRIKRKKVLSSKHRVILNSKKDYKQNFFALGFQITHVRFLGELKEQMAIKNALYSDFLKDEINLNYPILDNPTLVNLTI